MCGRYQFSADEYKEIRQIVRDAQRRSEGNELNFPMAGDICPSQVALVLVSRGEKIVGEFQQWGLPGFCGRQRCVIPATGFYEWDSANHKYFFQMPGQPIYLAGIYDNISGVNCFIILTTEPNDSVAPIHDRMPLLLSHEQVRPWLVDAGAALELLCSRPPLLLRTSCDGQLGFDDLL